MCKNGCAKKTLGLVVIISLVLAVFRAILIIKNMENNYDNHTYYLLANGKTKAFTIIAVALIPLLFAVAVYLFKGKRAVFDTKDVLSSAASCTLAFILLGTFLVFIRDYFKSESVANLTLAIAFFSILSGAVFIFMGLKGDGSNLLAAFTLVPMVFTLLRLLSDFLSTGATPFANSGGYHLMGLSVLLLFFLCEGKAFLSSGSAALLYGYGYIAILLLLVYALPDLALHCFSFGVFSFDYAAALSVADIVTAFYIAARLNSAKFEKLAKEE